MGLSASTQPPIYGPRTDIATPSLHVTSGGQAQPSAVWGLLTLEQQQMVFRTIVIVCRSMVRPPTGSANDGEVGNEQP